MIHPVPGARRRVRLLLVDPFGVVNVEPEEIDQLASAVDLSLKGRLALPEHGGGVHPVAVGAGEEVCRAEEDGGAINAECFAELLECGAEKFARVEAVD